MTMAQKYPKNGKHTEAIRKIFRKPLPTRNHQIVVERIRSGSTLHNQAAVRQSFNPNFTHRIATPNAG